MKIGLAAAIALCAVAAMAQNAGPITQYTLPADKLAKATALYDVRVRVYIFGIIYGFAVPTTLIWLKIGPRFRDVAERMTKRVWLQAFVFAPLMILSLMLLDLPFRLYRQHVGRVYGLVVQSWAGFFADFAKSTAIQVVVGTVGIWIGYFLMRRFPRRWWIFAWAIAAPVLIFFIFLTPLVIDPMFNHFESLEERRPKLVAEIQKVTLHGGLDIPRSRMYEMRASDKTTTMNAYVTGLGASKRVVVWDNTSKLLTIPRTLYVFGHEMGHYVLHHIWIGTAGAIAGLFMALFLAAKVAGWAISRWSERWGIRDVADYASLAVFLLILAVFSFAADPLAAAYSRHLEYEADRYGIEVVNGIVPDPQQTCAQSFQVMGENSLTYPWPNRLLVLWAYDHPPIADRVQFCLDYNPWAKGQPPKYVK